MTDYNVPYQQALYLSPEQQNLLLTALSTNPPQKPINRIVNGGTRPKIESSSASPLQSQTSHVDVTPSVFFESPTQDAPDSGQLGFGADESPFLEFDPDVDYDFPEADQMFEEIPGLSGLDDSEPREKRKGIDGEEEELEPGKKRRESEDKEKASKKPGRKPLTSEPTSKRKAQNRAAQRAFRERKEKHLRDLESKVEELEKASQSANQENGLLRAQVERLQVELREYRKRLSWLTSGNGASNLSSVRHGPSRSLTSLHNNDFHFDFPKFGDLPSAHTFTNGSLAKPGQNKLKENSPVSASRFDGLDFKAPGVLGRPIPNSLVATGQPPIIYNSTPNPVALSEKSRNGSINGASRAGYDVGNASFRTALGTSTTLSLSPMGKLIEGGDTSNYQIQPAGSSTVSNSPSCSSDSHHGQGSSIGTSPEPILNSPSMGKPNNQSGGSREEKRPAIDGEKSFCEQLNLACGTIDDPVPAAMKQSGNIPPSQGQHHMSAVEQPLSLDLLAQQNGGQFDPVLFHDYREPQDAVLSQDFGGFFNDAFPLPDLGSPFPNLGDVSVPPAPKRDLIAELDHKLEDDDEVVPGEDHSQMMTCTKIWDRLSKMEKFRNNEIDVDSLCTQLRNKARCSEGGGVVINEKDVEDIMGRV